MSGRGDNNKKGSSGRGASNQSMQSRPDESQEISDNIKKIQEKDKAKKKDSKKTPGRN
jgi:hypothetical protein